MLGQNNVYIAEWEAAFIRDAAKAFLEKVEHEAFYGPNFSGIDPYAKIQHLRRVWGELSNKLPGAMVRPADYMIVQFDPMKAYIGPIIKKINKGKIKGRFKKGKTTWNSSKSTTRQVKKSKTTKKSKQK